MCGSMADIQSAAAEIRRGKKKKEERTNHSMKIYMVSLFHRATIKEVQLHLTRSRHGLSNEPSTKVLRRPKLPQNGHLVPKFVVFRTISTIKDNKNSSGDEIANVNFYAVHPEATQIR